MFRKTINRRILIFSCLSFFFISLKPLFAETLASHYLCDFGIALYRMGRYDDALSEFRKALLAQPDNRTAQEYMNIIFQEELSLSGADVKKSPAMTREQVIDRTLYNYGKQKGPEDERPVIKSGPVEISGEIDMRAGFTSQDALWKRANFDLNEKFFSSRLTSEAGFNRRFNTYDPQIYDSLSVNLDAGKKQGFGFHTNVTVDPWSFTGKSNKVTISNNLNTDLSQLQLFYWSNTAYTVNNTNYSLLRADTFPLPELKVNEGKTTAATVNSFRYSGVTYTIPAMKINRQFQPLRELWLDYANEQLNLRAFPIAYQDQAYTSDDPLRITNHGIWWKDSKWLRQYTPGNFNPDDENAPSFTKGRWDDSLSFLAKDSTGRYLTGLRGAAFSFQPDAATTFDATAASPRNLWQDYAALDNAVFASRLKHYFSDDFMLGATFTNRSGFITEGKQRLDSLNFVGGVDLNYELTDGIGAQAEFLSSWSKYDINNSTYETDSRGNAYYFSLIGRYPYKKLMGLKYGYDEIARDEGESLLLKGKFYAVRMDKGFDSALADYHNTRQDVFWSRHIHFRQPLGYHSLGLDEPVDKWGELNSTRIGDGIDIARSVLGLRFEAFWEDTFANLFDVRNVHNANGKFIENVCRDEATFKLTDRLTAKGLGIYHKLHKTAGGIDPFIYDGKTGDFFLNNVIADGLDPSVGTGSLGLNYELLDWVSINGIYERTNDYGLAYGNFPQNTLRNDTTLFGTFVQEGNLYRFIQPFLFDQGIFPQPPYKFYNVFKCGLSLMPLDNLEIYLDYTYNQFKAASLVSDGMNHAGVELAYTPMEKLGLLFKYIYSRSQDVDRLQLGLTDITGHHNFFSELRYLPFQDDQLVLQYGVGDYAAIGNLASLDPYGGSMLTLDTQHIVRVYYRRKF